MKKTFIDNRFGTKQQVAVTFHRYSGSNNIAIRLVETESGLPWGIASVNIPGVTLSDDRVAIKNHTEGEGMDSLLIEAGIIEPGPVDFHPSGYVNIPVYQLTKEAHAEAVSVARH